MSEFLDNTSTSDSTYPEGHPVRVYLDENRYIRNLMQKLHQINLQEESEHYREVFEKLAKVELHFTRKENQLFPYLEKYGWTSPSQGMWTFHDQIRDQIKLTRKTIQQSSATEIEAQTQHLFQFLEQIMNVEENRLFPRAMGMLSEEEWQEFSEGDKEIGWMLEEPPSPYPPETYIHPSQDTSKRSLPFGTDDKTHYDEGYLTPEQVNSIFRILPVDITYVNEHDQVVFYNRGDNRVFPRSAGIIGREVRFCHPPKSVDQVLRILDEFKAGNKDLAEFWINFKGQFIHIQYFAVRDTDGTYRGVIEMSQDVSHVRGLEGEQRLLDWE